MPIYEYRCECGERLEAIEKVGTVRTTCAELCTQTGKKQGKGRVERLLSTGSIRGDGHEAQETVINPCKRSNRPGGGCGGCDEY